MSNDFEHNLADAPPSAIDAALARLNDRRIAEALVARYPLSKSARLAAADAAPALTLELAAADALEEAEDALLDVRDGTASYHDLAGSLERIAALLRGGLGDDHDDVA